MRILSDPRIKRWIWPVLLTLVGAVLGAGLGMLSVRGKPLVYTTSGSVLLTPGESATGEDALANSSYLQGQVQTYAAMVSTPMVLDGIAKELGLSESAGQLGQQVFGKATLNTAIIEITANGGSPEEAASIANAAQRSLIRVVAEISPKSKEGGGRLIEARVLRPAERPAVPSAPRRSVAMMLGLALGALLGWLVGTLVRRFHELASQTAREHSVPAPDGEVLIAPGRRSPRAAAYRALVSPYLGRQEDIETIVVLGDDREHAHSVDLGLVLSETNQRAAVLLPRELGRLVDAVPWHEIVTGSAAEDWVRYGGPLWLVDWEGISPEMALDRLALAASPRPGHPLTVVVACDSMQDSLLGGSWIRRGGPVIAAGEREGRLAGDTMGAADLGRLTVLRTA